MKKNPSNDEIITKFCEELSQGKINILSTEDQNYENALILQSLISNNIEKISINAKKGIEKLIEEDKKDKVVILFINYIYNLMYN